MAFSPEIEIGMGCKEKNLRKLRMPLEWVQALRRKENKECEPGGRQPELSAL